MNLPLYQVDAFTDRPFRGNPAAVCLVQDQFPADAWLQSVAAEMNLSETAFLCRQATGQYQLRWFTPGTEVDLCGHATLAAAHVLYETERESPEQPLTFATRSGHLQVTHSPQGLHMDFPQQAARPCESPAGLAEALGCAVQDVGWNGSDYLVCVSDREVLLSLAPDFRKLAMIKARGIIVTSAGEGTEFDFWSRFFGPAVQVDEDPVTGSAHCCLGPYWAERLGRQQLRAYQASARGGVVQLTCHGERVELIGQAVLVLAGELLVDV